MTDEQSPRSAGYYMPPEWAEHDATWLAWPKNELTFHADILPAVEQAYCQMISALSFGEQVNVLIDDEPTKVLARKLMSAYDRREKSIIFHRIRTSDVWIRDYGPTFLINQSTGRKAAVKWVFNAWGNRYEDILYDNIAGDDIANAAQVEVYKPKFVLEGGSIDVNGAGYVMTSEQCLLNSNRNPGLKKPQIEGYLRDYLGVEEVIWLSSGIEGDDTDGHIDDFARFACEKKVLCSWGGNASDANAEVLEGNYRALKDYASVLGLEIVKLPMPEPVFDKGSGQRLPASYANFYVANKTVLLPVFGDPCDDDAGGILEGCFPGRRVVPIRATELVSGYGGIHCVTQQEPNEKA